MLGIYVTLNSDQKLVTLCPIKVNELFTWASKKISNLCLDYFDDYLDHDLDNLY
jgi:hypothetical protein